MLQWVPGSSENIIWNDREGDHYVSRLMNIRTRAIRTLPRAIYALSTQGDRAIGTEFSRIQNLRPGYGYAGVPDPYVQVKAPYEAGLYKMNLHPRFSPDAKKVVIDPTHEGMGRQLYLLDISQVKDLLLPS